MQSLGEWSRIFRYSEVFTLKASQWRHPATQQESPWKLELSCGRHTGKCLRCNIILVKLLGKFTRIIPHGFTQNTSSFIQSPGEETFRKQTSPRIPRYTAQKSVGIALTERIIFPSGNWTKKPAFHPMW